MGTWGKLPWDNDGAADWFGDLFDKTNLAKHVEETLKLDVADFHEEVRAAASVVLLLGRVYTWPVSDLNRHLSLAADKLEEISRLDEITESEELLNEIRGEILELRSRIKTPGASAQPQTPPKKWWQLWS